MTSPYENLASNKFWKTAVADTTPQTAGGLYTPKFPLSPATKIATAGSCFAQHIARYLRARDFFVLDVEQPPPLMTEEMRKDYGFGLYSARYGNIYTARQLLQLAQDAFSGRVDASDVWERDGRYYDAIRPNVEPKGFDSVDEALANRQAHLSKVSKLFRTMDVFIFTFGLTESWINRDTGRVYPTAPGTIAGDFDSKVHEFKNFNFNDVHDDFVAFRTLIHQHNPGVQFMLTVSPVPLTATATDNHVLVATTYSKSVLRAVAGALCAEHPDIDYVPSYEMIATPWARGRFFKSNLRSVTDEGVASVMRMFFLAHGIAEGETLAPEDRASGDVESPSRRADGFDDIRQRKRAKREARHKESKSGEEICEEILLEAFAPAPPH